MGATIGTTLAVIGTAKAVQGAAQAIKPNVPGPKPPPLMPDQNTIDLAAKKSAAEQLSRTGRAATVLSGNTDTGDRLGP